MSNNPTDSRRCKAQKNAGYGQRPYPAFRSTAQNLLRNPLYKEQNRRYNKNRNVPIIRLRMELILRMQEAGVGRTCFCIALFVPYKGNYTAFWKIVKGHLSVSGKNRAYQNDLAPAKPVPFWCSGWLHRIANDVSSEYNRFRIITVGS